MCIRWEQPKKAWVRLTYTRSTTPMFEMCNSVEVLYLSCRDARIYEVTPN